MPTPAQSYLAWLQAERARGQRAEEMAEYSAPALLISSAAMISTGLGGKLIGSGEVRAIAGAMDDYLANNRYLRKLLPSIHEGHTNLLRRGDLSREEAKQALRDRRVQQSFDLEALYAIAKSHSPFVGATDKVVGSALDTMMRHAPRTYSHGVRDLTMHDLLGGDKKLLDNATSLLGADVSSTVQSFQGIMRSAGGQAFRAKTGLTKAQVAQGIKIGTGIHVSGSNILDVGRYSASNLVSWLGNFKFPFTKWKPFELLFPTELVYRQPIVQRVGGAYTQKMMDTMGMQARSAVFSGGKVFPVKGGIKAPRTGGPGGVHRESRILLGEPLPGNYLLGRTSGGMFRGAQARLGISPGWETPEKYLQKEDILTPDQAHAIEEFRKAGNKVTFDYIQKVTKRQFSRFERAKIKATLFGQKVGIGPHFATADSKLYGIWKNLVNAGKGTPKPVKEVVSGQFRIPPRRVPQNTWLDKLKKLAGLERSNARKLNDYTLSEKIGMKFGFEPKRDVQYTTPYGNERTTRARVASFGGHKDSGLINRPKGRGEFYLMPQGRKFKGGPGVSDWLNYQVMRPNWLLEETLGVNIMPGRNALGTLGRVMSKVVAPTAVGLTALQYVDYKARDLGLPGPISGALQTYAAARVGVQQVLDTTGITSIAKTLEEQFPGLLDSPISRAVTAGAATLGGISMAQAGLGLPGLIGGMALGFHSAAGITKTSTELESIYSGEADVPVRKGRWWMLGRCVHPDTLVLADWGRSEKAGDVHIGDYLVTKTGATRKVKDVIRRELENDECLYSMSVSLNNAVPTLVTDIHPLLCMKLKPCEYKGSYKTCRPDRDAVIPCQKNKCKKEFHYDWVRASDVEVGDFLAFPVPELGNSTIINGKSVDRTLAFLIGHYIAEGNLHRKFENGTGYILEITCHKDELEYVESKWASKAKTSSKTQGNTGKLRVKDKDLATWIYNLIGSGKSKRFPSELFTLRPDLLKEVIIGYFYGDGHFGVRKSRKSVTASITSSNLDLILGTQQALAALGYVSSVTDHTSKYNNKYYKGYRLHLDGKLLPDLYKAGQSELANKNEKCSKYSFFYDGYLFSQIVRKEEIEYEGEVLDFEVEEDSSFCGVSFILHNSPFGGGKISYFRKHAIPEYLSGAKEKALYGSEREAWAHSWLPTPESLFGLRPLLDPYALERKHYYDRPYPVTGSAAEEIPIIGPIVNSKISPLHYLKPQYKMHPEAWRGGVLADERIPTEAEWAAGDMGLGVKMNQERSVMRTRLDQMTGEMIYNLEQWTGMTGFMIGEITRLATGSSDVLDKRDQIATSGAMASIQRDFYDRELGGLLGQTEYLRRFIPRGRNQIRQINPIKNTMPQWLPGSQSVFERDRDNNIDFLVGDAYTKLQKGDVRLPGPGYEALHRMHSGVPGVYDAVDRFLVLSNTSPGSDAYRHYSKIVSGMKLDDYWSSKVARARDQIEQIRESQFEEPKSKRVFQEQSVQIAEVIGASKFRDEAGRTYELAGVEGSPHLQAWKSKMMEQDASDIEAKYHALENELRSLEGKQVRIQAGATGYGAATPAIIPGVNDQAIQSGLASDASTPADYQAKYGRGAMTSLWDKIRHMDVPGPAGWVPTKFFSRRSALEDYQMSNIEGGGFAGWESPYKNFVRYWGRQTENMFRSDPRIPSEVEEKRKMDTYFTNLKYVQGRRYENIAIAAGMPESAEVYNRMWRSTMPGIQTKDANLTRDIWGAMPKTERPYFKQFARETDPEYQAKILQMTPPSMKNIYLGIWQSNRPKIGEMASLPPKSQGPNNQVSQQVTDAQVREYFNSYKLPEDSWSGWDPAIDPEHIEARTVAHHAEDIHRHGIWESQVRASEARQAPIAPYMSAKGSASDEDLMWDQLGNMQRRQLLEQYHAARFGYQTNYAGV